MDSHSIRRQFLDFFASKGHVVVDSAPIVVKNDPTLMFANAGMNPFKDIFLGNRPPAHKRVTDTQKCLRVSGKHNDLEEVGKDTYHHTMFEMLGNWSFGDYYKDEAIDWAWELLTEVYGIDPERLYATVFAGDEADGLPFDQPAYDRWKKHLPESRIIGAGKKDNFWEMGETGPCGPCSEIHIDTRSDAERAKIEGRELVNADHPGVVEIWNLVFMELNRRSDGSLVPLNSKHIDTGMGFERLCMVLQNKTATYDTDVFSDLLAHLEKASGLKYKGGDSKSDVAFRVMVDHVRAVAFAIADGQLPSNSGAGYVIRRILRRAVRYGYSFLGLKEPTLCGLAETLIGGMGGFFGELKHNNELIVRVIREEEESFLRTLAKGMDRIASIVAATPGDTVPGRVVFELYDTYGFPADLSALILAESGKTYDQGEFDAALSVQKERSRKAGTLDTGDWTVVHPGSDTEFVGYDALESPMQLLRYRKVKQKGKDKYHLVFDRTPFYPEGGGQVGDTGKVESVKGSLPIVNVFKENTLIIHESPKSPAEFGADFTGRVSAPKRRDTARNHTATHLLHRALRQVLGDHVEQKGSLVAPDHLRFDFSHFAKTEPEQLREIEHRVNAWVRENLPLEEKRDAPVEEALAEGAMALFGEKYGDRVRVVRFGDSVELCGGTHLAATGEIGFFRIVSEGSVASGVRRIEAVTGTAAEKLVFEAFDTLTDIGRALKSPRSPLKSIANLQAENAALLAETEALKRDKAAGLKRGLVDKVESINGLNFLAAEVDLDPGSVKDLAYGLRAEHAPLFLVLATRQKGKATISVALSDDLVTDGRFNSSRVVKELASYIRGGGGGQPSFATAGGKHPEGIGPALDRARELVGG